MQYRAAQALPQGGGGGGYYPTYPTSAAGGGVSGNAPTLAGMQVLLDTAGGPLAVTLQAEPLVPITGVVLDSSLRVIGHMTIVTAPAATGYLVPINLTSLGDLSAEYVGQPLTVVAGPASVIGRPGIGQVFDLNLADMLAIGFVVQAAAPSAPSGTPATGSTSGQQPQGSQGQGAPAQQPSTVPLSGTNIYNPAQQFSPLTGIRIWWDGLPTVEKAAIGVGAAAAVYFALR